ncbi:MAG: hypothetical protein PVJ80_10340 [Gemmatimonadota bacterium]
MSSVEVSVDSAGPFPVVHNAGQPPQWSIERIGSVGSVGSMAEAAPDEFGRVSSVTTGPDSTVWVADRYASLIKAFRPDGSLRLQIGGEGQGPGEFSSVTSLAWVGRRLLALDLGNGRVAELAPDGTWLGSRPAPGSISGSSATLRFYPASDTTVIQWSIASADGQMRRMWVLQGVDGPLGSWPQPKAEQAETVLLCNRSDGSIHFFDIPFAGQVLRHPLQDGSGYRAWTAEYRFVLVDADGDTARVVERSWPSLPVTDAMWAEGTAEFEAFRADAPDADCSPGSMERPAERTPIENLLMDDEGRVWIEAARATDTVWEVFDARGRLLASVPGFDYDKSVAPSIRGGLMAWVRTDSLDVQYVEWGRLVESATPTLPSKNGLTG